MNTTAPIPAADLLSVPPDLPQGTPLSSATTPPVAAPPPSTPDRAGQVWDGTYHETPPRLNAEGKWAKLRGNAARRAKGLPPTGAFTGKAFAARPAPDLAAPAPQPVPAPDPLPFASQPPPAAMLGGVEGATGPVLDAVADTLPDARPLEAYGPTAAGLVDGTFGVAQLTMGKAWELTSQERRSLVDCSQRVLHHYQAPVLGPLLELVLLLVPIIGKRRSDPETRAAWKGLLAWFTKPRSAAAAADPYRDAPPAPGSSAPAAPLPDAYRDAPPAAPLPRVAWIP
jgi:hypothetical protein